MQATMVEPGRIVFQDVPEPEPGRGQVVIEVRACGICGSDVHVWRGEHPFTSYPIVQGHEFSGVVKSVGEEVEGITPGTKVTVEPSLVCGRCYPCRHGRYNICYNLKVMGFQADGCHREFFAVPADRVVPVPEDMPFEAAAMVEPSAVALHAVGRAEMHEGAKVVVLGAGTIGILTMQAAKALGASEVMMTDIVDFKLEVARRLGADHVVNARREEVVEAIEGTFGEDRADLVFECVGAEETLEAAVQGARKGSRIVVVGVIGGRPRVSIGLLQDRELEMVGSLMYVRDDFLKAVDLISSGRLTPTELITSRYRFRDLAEAYREAAERGERNLKVMVEF